MPNVKGYSYKREGKTIQVKGYQRKSGKRSGTRTRKIKTPIDRVKTPINKVKTPINRVKTPIDKVTWRI